MGRRYKKSPAEEAFEMLIDISSTFPWWLSVGGALLLFVFVPFDLTPSQSGVPSAEQAGAFIAKILLVMLFKFFIPLAFFFGGLVNLFKHGKRAWMFKTISTKGARETLRNLSWKDFEFLISEYFKKKGYQVKLVGGNGADGGVDVELRKDGELFLVQCKHYKAWKVSVTVVRELNGVIAARDASGGFVITTGRFTKEARTFGSQVGIELFDGAKLEKLLDGAQVEEVLESETSSEAEICPRCGKSLVKRKGSRGEFWGCSAFPKCRFTKSL